MTSATRPRARCGHWLAALSLSLSLSFSLWACSADDEPGDSADAAAAGGLDAAPLDQADAGDQPGRPQLSCDPAAVGVEDLCACMADIVCDQIYYCLGEAELAAKPEYWRPQERCVAELLEDCLEDSSDASYLPEDFPGCVTDIAFATCEDFDSFSSVADDFPASCENLRALDTGLGIPQE